MMRRLLVGLVLAALFSGAARAEYGIATAHPLATQAGEQILAAGGNAFDAAVAITAALAVVEPAGSGLGGGGFYLLHQRDTGRKIFVDARETAPSASTADMYQDDTGEVQRDWLRASPLAAGIPGIPAALEHLAEKYGELPLARSLAPAIRYARDGFAVDHKLARYLQWRQSDLSRHPASAALFLPDGQPLADGEPLVQVDLADTLERIAVFGADGFYQGGVAERMVAAVRAAGGIWQLADLAGYTVVERPPVVLDYRGWQIFSAPPPSSGGLVLGIIFNILAGYDWSQLTEVDRIHFIVEAMRRAYHDRARFMGDSDFVKVPSAGLLRPAYAESWRKSIQSRRATPSAAFGSELPDGGQGENTTHFSVVDEAGNRVAATLSINYALGSSFVAGDTGVLLNNEMDDFVAKPGVPNAYGLIGGQANAIEPGKRMLSSMSPTFLEGRDRIAVLGTPGGSRIITMVMHAIHAVMAGADAEAVVSQPRYHHQYLPDEIAFEPEALSAAVQAQLKARGHALKPMGRRYGNFQAVIIDRQSGALDAAADPRGVGLAVVGQTPAKAPAQLRLPGE